MMLRLPLPPSVNNLYPTIRDRRTGKLRRIKSDEYKRWLDQADKWLTTQKRTLRKISGPCSILIRIPVSRADASNRIKVAEDFLVSRELTDDDKHNRRVTVEVDEKLECCEIIILPSGASERSRLMDTATPSAGMEDA